MRSPRYTTCVAEFPVIGRFEDELMAAVMLISSIHGIKTVAKEHPIVIEEADNAPGQEDVAEHPPAEDELGGGDI